MNEPRSRHAKIILHHFTREGVGYIYIYIYIHMTSDDEAPQSDIASSTSKSYREVREG